MWTGEHTETTDASPAQVWARYADPRTWAEWDSAIERVTFTGPFEVGARGTLTPVGGPTTRFTLTRISPGAGFTDVARLPLARLSFDHRIEPDGAGSRLTHTVTITGLLSPVFARVIGRGVVRELPGAMQALARLARTVPPSRAR